MLEIEGLTKSFDGRPVLRGLDLSVDAGEGVALLGGNGSGKTTTLRAIAGLVLPDSGRITVDGLDARRDGRKARARLSFLPQKSVFPGTLSVRETLEVAASLRRLPQASVARELSECGLVEASERSVSTLSGGQRQRLGLAVAFLPDVPLYLFDEPTANLDPPSLEVFFRRARELREAGRAVLFTTHVSADVEKLATRVEILVEGRVERAAGVLPFPAAVPIRQGSVNRAVR
jgi:ABC-type multidrug transport system ATPase subunit